jgi:ubiquitin C-terminal hydrolase
MIEGQKPGNDKTINFSDCLDDYFKTHLLDADNCLTCEACGKQNRSEIKFKLKSCKWFPAKFKSAAHFDCANEAL